MTADELVKIVRGGSDKLRVDNIVLAFGGQEFHGSGTMQVVQDEIKLVVHLNGEEKFPDPNHRIACTHLHTSHSFPA